MRNLLVVSALSLAGWVSAVRAEDPLLGIVRAVKCLNCVADSVVLLVDDPIDGQEIEVKVPTREYNKILVSLQGRRLFIPADGQCFYWQEKPKAAPKDTSAAKATTSKRPVKGSAAPAAPAMTEAAAEPKASVCIPYTATYKGIH